jgi:hypothetical protein
VSAGFCRPWAYSSDKHGKRVIWPTVDAIRPSVSISSADRYFGAQSPSFENLAIGFESVQRGRHGHETFVAVIFVFRWVRPFTLCRAGRHGRVNQWTLIPCDCHNFKKKKKMIFNSFDVLSGTESTRGLKSTGNDEINSTV